MQYIHCHLYNAVVLDVTLYPYFLLTIKQLMKISIDSITVQFIISRQFTILLGN